VIQDLVLQREWHPVLRASELKDQPVAVRVLDEPVVVFRTKDGVHAFKDLCIHRGVPLSLGKIVDDELMCPYHGWRYNASGMCTRIPAMPADRTIPAKARAIAYRCVEAANLIWVCTGTPETERPVAVELLDEKLKCTEMGPYRLNASGPRVIENFLDVSHLMFVHEGLLGDARFAEIEDYRVHEIDGRLRTDEIRVYQPNPDGLGRPTVNRYVYEVFHPLCAALTKYGEEGQFFKLFLFVLPETETRSTAFMILQRNYALDEPDEPFIAFQNVLIEQDRAIVERQTPELLPLDLQAELHLTCDRLSIAYRRSLKEQGVSFGTA